MAKSAGCLKGTEFENNLDPNAALSGKLGSPVIGDARVSANTSKPGASPEFVDRDHQTAVGSAGSAQ
jgi:hypothetical protein